MLHLLETALLEYSNPMNFCLGLSYVASMARCSHHAKNRMQPSSFNSACLNDCRKVWKHVSNTYDILHVADEIKDEK